MVGFLRARRHAWMAVGGFGDPTLCHPGGLTRGLAYAVEKLGQYGRRLRPNDIIMTGSFVRQFPLEAGDIAIAEFSGIGRVEVRIAKA